MPIVTVGVPVVEKHAFNIDLSLVERSGVLVAQSAIQRISKTSVPDNCGAVLGPRNNVLLATSTFKFRFARTCQHDPACPVPPVEQLRIECRHCGGICSAG